MAATTFFGPQAQQKENAEAVPLRPREESTDQNIQAIGVLPQAIPQASRTPIKKTMQDFEPPAAVMAGFTIHKEKG